MSSIDAPALLGFAVGITGTLAAFGAKYAFDFRLGKRRIELDERAALATTLGGRPGQLRRTSIRLKDRVDGIFRDASNLPTWLAQAPSPSADGYFLSSTVHRLFLFLGWGALMQQALDSLPDETLRARRDLQRQYALLDLSGRVLTSINLFPGYPGYRTDRDGYHLFTGTTDELADLGVAAYNRNAQVIPSSEFSDAYTRAEPSLMRLREWVSEMGTDGARAPVIMARFACLGAVLTELLESSATPDFSSAPMLRARLADLQGAEGYDFAAVLPPWLDAEFAGAGARWQRPH